MSIDVCGNVFIGSGSFVNIPLLFGEVSGYFDCSDNILTSLYGCPHYVGGDFFCNRNRLTTLLYGPKYVKGIFTCNGNFITSLEYGPTFIGKHFGCRDNFISTRQSLLLLSVDGNIYSDNLWKF